MASFIVFHGSFIFPLEAKTFLAKNSFFDLILKELTLSRACWYTFIMVCDLFLIPGFLS